MLLEKAKFDAIKVLVPKALYDLYISHEESVSIYRLLREYNEMKEEIKDPKTSVEYTKNRKTYERNGVETIVDTDGILGWVKNI